MARTYVVTGAASGIAKATKELLESRGNKVIGVDINHTDVVADLSTKQGRVDGARKGVEAAGGAVDAVISCAGVAVMTPLTVSVNYFGMTGFLNAMAPTLAKAEAPRAVLISSISSLQPSHRPLVEAMCIDDDEAKARAIAQSLVDAGDGSDQLIYASTKLAIARWVRRECIKPQWAGAGIPLNAIGPGIVQTPMTAELLATAEGRKMMEEMVPMPLHGFLKPEQIAPLLAWLASVENTHVTGQTIYIDGGYDATARGENIWDLT